MDWEILALVLVGFMALMLMLGQWTALVLGTVGTLLLYLSRGEVGLLAISSVVWNTSNSYILIALPMFLLMGEVILRSGISDKFYRGITALMGGLPGGLLHANIVSCALFSAVSGSSVATAASVGTVAIPEMTKRGYAPRLVFGSLAAGGTLGILIPPSIVMILYGALVEESITKLFMAGIIPGLVLSALFMLYLAIRVALQRSLAPPREAPAPLLDRLRAAVHVVPIVGLLLVVLGGIYAGLITPTEAAAVGAAGAIALGLCYGGLTRAILGEALLSSVKTTCMVIFIIIGAQILSSALSYSGVSRGISQFIVDLEMSKWTLFLGLVVLYVLLGFFVDGISMIYITLPVLFPVVVQAGFDTIWFGVVITILIELGQITPPMGLNLFAIHGISGSKYGFGEVVAGSTPFVFLMLLMIALLAFFPALALWIPSLM